MVSRVMKLVRRRLPHEPVPVWAPRGDVPPGSLGAHYTLCCQVCHRSLRGEYGDHAWRYPTDESFIADYSLH